MKPELRSHKNVIYELSRSESGWSFLIRDFNIRSELFEQKTDAIDAARQKIEELKGKKQ